MSDKYDKLYAEHRHALGEPFSEVIEYFNSLTPPKRVLDLGAGQGRDAIFIAKLGHSVHAVDLSATGLQQLAQDTKDLEVTTEVADICAYNPASRFDVILIDRTLHMVGVKNGVNVLERMIEALDEGGEIYILDEKKDIPKYQQILADAHLQEIAQTATSLRYRRVAG